MAVTIIAERNILVVDCNFLKKLHHFQTGVQPCSFSQRITNSGSSIWKDYGTSFSSEKMWFHV